MPRTVIGMRIRDRRKALKISQADLATRLGISPSYLNLIEHNKRGIAGRLLNAIASQLDLSLEELDGATERLAARELMEIATDPMMQGIELAPETATEFVGRHPEWARALATAFRGYQGKSAAVAALSDRLNHDPFLSDSVHKMLTNIAAIRSTSDILADVSEIEPEQRKRFYNILAEESARLSDVSEALAAFFDRAHTEERAVAPIEEVEDFLFQRNNYFHAVEIAAEELRHKISPSKHLSEADLVAHLGEQSQSIATDIPHESRRFALAVIAVKNAMGTIIGAQVDGVSDLTSQAARRRAREAVATYGASALLMPYKTFLADAKELRYDIERLQRRYGASYEQVCHRLATLRRPGAEGIQFGFIRTNLAGHIAKRLQLPRLPLPRYGAACPLWVLYRAFMTPEVLTRQLVEFPSGERFLFVAKVAAKGATGFNRPRNFLSVMLACEAIQADQTVYGDGLNVAAEVEPVGPNCRICTRDDCAYRIEDPILNA